MDNNSLTIQQAYYEALFSDMEYAHKLVQQDVEQKIDIFEKDILLRIIEIENIDILYQISQWEELDDRNFPTMANLIYLLMWINRKPHLFSNFMAYIEHCGKYNKDKYMLSFIINSYAWGWLNMIHALIELSETDGYQKYDLHSLFYKNKIYIDILLNDNPIYELSWLIDYSHLPGYTPINVGDCPDFITICLRYNKFECLGWILQQITNSGQAINYQQIFDNYISSISLLHFDNNKKGIMQSIKFLDTLSENNLIWDDSDNAQIISAVYQQYLMDGEIC